MQVLGAQGLDSDTGLGPLHMGNDEEQPHPQGQAPVGAAAAGAVNGGARQQGEAAAEDGMTAHRTPLKTEQQQKHSPHQESKSEVITLDSDDECGDGGSVPRMQGKLQ